MIKHTKLLLAGMLVLAPAFSALAAPKVATGCGEAVHAVKNSGIKNINGEKRTDKGIAAFLVNIKEPS